MDRTNFGYSRRDFTAQPARDFASRPSPARGVRKEITVTGPADGGLVIGSDVAGASVEVTTDDGTVTYQERLPDGSAGDSLVVTVAPPPAA